jgi:hypothetical protein
MQTFLSSSKVKQKIFSGRTLPLESFVETGGWELVQVLDAQIEVEA